jgi:hypothetical protein
MKRWAENIKTVEEERIKLAIIAANNHYAGFGHHLSIYYEIHRLIYCNNLQFYIVIIEYLYERANQPEVRSLCRV